MAESSNGSKKPNNSRGSPAKKGSLSPAELQSQLERSQTKLHQTEMLLSVTQKIAGLKNLSEILWTLIEMTTQELGADRGKPFPQ